MLIKTKSATEIQNKIKFVYDLYCINISLVWRKEYEYWNNRVFYNNRGFIVSTWNSDT
jgi:hypothetical protein